MNYVDVCTGIDAVPVMRWLGERIQMVEDLCNQKGEVK